MNLSGTLDFPRESKPAAPGRFTAAVEVQSRSEKAVREQGNCLLMPSHWQRGLYPTNEPKQPCRAKRAWWRAFFEWACEDQTSNTLYVL